LYNSERLARSVIQIHADSGQIVPGPKGHNGRS